MSWKTEPIQAEGLDTRKSPRGRRNIPVYHGSGLLIVPFVYDSHLLPCVTQGIQLALYRYFISILGSVVYHQDMAWVFWNFFPVIIM